MRVLVVPEGYKETSQIDSAIAWWRHIMHPHEPLPKKEMVEISEVDIEVVSGMVNDWNTRRNGRIGVWIDYHGEVIVKIICQYAGCHNCPPVSQMVKLDNDGNCIIL